MNALGRFWFRDVLFHLWYRVAYDSSTLRQIPDTAVAAAVDPAFLFEREATVISSYSI